jgi:predicted TIM-barrel fold metal-dependent hydrolase
MQTNIVVPQWLSKDYGPFYTKLVSNISEFNRKNAIPTLNEAAWTTQFNLIVSGLNTWKSTDRRSLVLEFGSIVVGFGAFIKQNQLEAQYKSLLDSANYTSIFTFQGLSKESVGWTNEYILNNGNIANLTNIATKINGAVAFETAQMTSIKNQMSTIIQDRSFQNLVKSDLGKETFTNRLGLNKLSNLNTGSLVI